jgi:DNA ligase (NAD+)
MVEVVRAGKIIPKIVSVDKKKRPKNAVKAKLPQDCPCCGRRLTRKTGYVDWMCVNLMCLAKRKEQLLYFVSQPAMDIDSIGPKLIDKILEKWPQFDVYDLYQLTPEQLTQELGVGQRMAAKICRNIQKSKDHGLEKVLVGLGVPMVGKTLARDLAREYRNIHEMHQDKKGIRPEAADESWEAHWPVTRDRILALEQLGVSVVSKKPNKSAVMPQVLSGKNVVVTGSFDIPRKEIEEWVRDVGGVIKPSVSSKVDLVLAGEKAGSKLDKAKKLKIQVWYEDRFQEARQKSLETYSQAKEVL